MSCCLLKKIWQYNKKTMKKLFAIFILGVILLMEGGFVLAQTPAVDCEQYCSDPTTYSEPEGITCICSPIKYKSISELVKAISNWIFWLALIIAPIMIVIGAFMFLTSAGDPGKTQRGIDLLKWTSIGLAVILGSKLIIALIKKILGA